jgi:hypothetical protein
VFDDDNDALCFAFGGGGVLLTMLPPRGGQRQQRWRKMTYAFLARGTRGGNNGQQINNTTSLGHHQPQK